MCLSLCVCGFGMLSRLFLVGCVGVFACLSVSLCVHGFLKPCLLYTTCVYKQLHVHVHTYKDMQLINTLSLHIIELVAGVWWCIWKSVSIHGMGRVEFRVPSSGLSSSFSNSFSSAGDFRHWCC